MSGPLWQPDPAAVRRTVLDRVMREVEKITDLPMTTTADFHDFSISSPGDFWDLVWGECEVIGDRGDGSAVVPPPPGHDLRATRFFPAARLNYAQNLLAGGNLPGAQDTALVFRREDGVRRVWSWAELRNATGDAGRVLRENKHRLEVDGKNMVGTAIRERQPQVVMDTVGNHVRFDNPLLPYTRSEIALPLIVGDRVLGALDAQSTKDSAFDPEDIETLQTMANQIAIALENARLFQEARQNLQDMHAIQQQYLLDTWKRVTDERPNLSFENGEVEPHETVRQIDIPLSLRDQIIGQINLTGDNDWTPEERSMIEAIASQAALALENARLVEDSQSTARRERMVAEITGKIWSSSTIDGIMQTAAREMGRALDTDEVTIELKAD